MLLQQHLCDQDSRRWPDRVYANGVDRVLACSGGVHGPPASSRHSVHADLSSLAVVATARISRQHCLENPSKEEEEEEEEEEEKGEKEETRIRTSTCIRELGLVDD